MWVFFNSYFFSKQKHMTGDKAKKLKSRTMGLTLLQPAPYEPPAADPFMTKYLLLHLRAEHFLK